MVYKNGFKEYAIICCAGGGAYGLIMGIFFEDLMLGLLCGVLFGVIFTLILWIFSSHLEKKSQYIRSEIGKTTHIICEGPANRQRGANAIGGWMFLTDYALDFFPHKINIGGRSIPIYIDDIAGVEVKSNKLIIRTKAYETYIFVVNKANLWKQSLDARMYGAPAANIPYHY